MNAKTASAQTSLSVQECGEAFQVAVSRAKGFRSHIGGFVAKAAGSDNSGFFTPRDDSPFSALDTDKPTFMVGYNISKMTNAAAGNVATIHMYVWERGTHRDLEFASPHGMMGGGSAAKLVRKILADFEQMDPSLSVTTVP